MYNPESSSAAQRKLGIDQDQKAGTERKKEQRK